jgi:hypothetical protein
LRHAQRPEPIRSVGAPFEVERVIDQIRPDLNEDRA